MKRYSWYLRRPRIGGLSQQMANCLKVQFGDIRIETFPDGEIGVQILENVPGRDAFVLQTIARRPTSISWNCSLLPTL